jgi:hypothetical protein
LCHDYFFLGFNVYETQFFQTVDCGASVVFSCGCASCSQVNCSIVKGIPNAFVLFTSCLAILLYAVHIASILLCIASINTHCASFDNTLLHQAIKVAICCFVLSIAH